MWNHILGHTQAVATLRQLLCAGRLPQCLLLAGPEGIGKRLLARTAAAAFWCTAAPTGEACGVCAACGQISAGTWPDLSWVELETSPTTKKLRTEIVIDQIRALTARLQLRSISPQGKIGVIDTAEAMNTHAANSCLKLLEEPPANTHLILLSSRPQDLLPTIRSRCQVLTLAPLETALIARHLESTGVDAATAKQRAVLSQGSLAQALALPSDLLAETVQQLHQLVTPQAADLLDIAAQWVDDDASLLTRLYIMATLWRDSLAQHAAVTAPSIPATGQLTQQLAQRPGGRLQRELRAILDTLRRCDDTTANKLLSCEALLLSVAA